MVIMSSTRCSFKRGLKEKPKEIRHKNHNDIADDTRPSFDIVIEQSNNFWHVQRREHFIVRETFSLLKSKLAAKTLSLLPLCFSLFVCFIYLEGKAAWQTRKTWKQLHRHHIIHLQRLDSSHRTQAIFHRSAWRRVSNSKTQRPGLSNFFPVIDSRASCAFSCRDRNAHTQRHNLAFFPPTHRLHFRQGKKIPERTLFSLTLRLSKSANLFSGAPSATTQRPPSVFFS